MDWRLLLQYLECNDPCGHLIKRLRDLRNDMRTVLDHWTHSPIATLDRFLDRNFALEMMQILNEATVRYPGWRLHRQDSELLKQEKEMLERAIDGKLLNRSPSERTTYYKEELRRVGNELERSAHSSSSSSHSYPSSQRSGKSTVFQTFFDLFQSSTSFHQLLEERTKIEERAFSMPVSEEELLRVWMRDMKRIDQRIDQTSQGKNARWWPSYVQFLNQEIMFGKEPPRLDVDSCEMKITDNPSEITAGDTVQFEIVATDQYGNAMAESDLVVEVVLQPVPVRDDEAGSRISITATFDPSDSLFRARVTITRAASHKAILRIGGKSILERPLPDVRAGPVSLSTCRLVSALPERLDAGGTYEVRMETVDQYGNASCRGQGGDEICLTLMFDDSVTRYIELVQGAIGCFSASLSIDEHHVGGAYAWDLKLMDSATQPFDNGSSLLSQFNLKSYDPDIRQIEGRPYTRPPPISNSSPSWTSPPVTSTKIQDPKLSTSVPLTASPSTMSSSNNNSNGTLLQSPQRSTSRLTGTSENRARKTLYLSIVGWNPPSNLEALITGFANEGTPVDVELIQSSADSLSEQCVDLRRMSSRERHPARTAHNHIILCHERPATQSTTRDHDNRFLIPLSRISDHVLHVVTDQLGHFNSHHRGKSYWGAQSANHTSGIFLGDRTGRERRMTLYFVVSKGENAILRGTDGEDYQVNDQFLDGLRDLAQAVVGNI